MSALSALKGLLGGGASGGGDGPYTPVPDPFLEIDVDALAAQMRLEEEGKDRGEADLPPTDTKSMDDLELAVVDRIENEAERAYRECIHELRVLDNRLYGLDLIGNFSQARSAASSAIADFVAEARIWQNNLSDKRRAVAQVHDHIQEFRRENNLRRLAHKPLNSVEYLGTVCFAIILEAGINSIFLRVNDDLGYIGGAIMAVAIAFVNVVVATIFGKLVMPQKNSVHAGTRIRGMTLIALYIILAALLNLVGAHYRYLKGLDVQNPGGAAITSFLHNPVGIPDFISWLLVAFGLGCSFIALWAGYRSDDEYPNYGRVSRQYQDVLNDYNDGLADAYDSLTRIKNEAAEVATQLEKKLARDRREYEAALVSRTSLLGLYGARHPSLETAGNRLLGIYRTANRKARNAPSPDHFDQRWTLRRLAEPTVAPPPDQGGANLDTELAQTRRALSDAVEEINAAFVKHVESFKPMDELLD